MNKFNSAIQYLTERVRLAWMVFRENPDDVVLLSETENGSVRFRYRMGVGFADNHRMALEGIANGYALFYGQTGLDESEDSEDGGDT